jgi:hypothetical protein
MSHYENLIIEEEFKSSNGLILAFNIETNNFKEDTIKIGDTLNHKDKKCEIVRIDRMVKTFTGAPKSNNFILLVKELNK